MSTHHEWRRARRRPASDSRHARMQAAARWPLDECLITEDWQERGQAAVVFVRKAPDGRYAVAGFVVDLLCFGVRDVRVELGVDRAGMHDLIDRIAIGRLVRADPRVLAGVVRAGEVWGETLGFPAHCDLVWARAIFDAIEAPDRPVGVGSQGRAVVQPGPYALPEALARVERSLGPNGAVVVARLPVTPMA